tara:strand:- start:1051 stop:1560 length:510 start_codon:yes stop_codon:yes gene_type:complete
MLAIILLSCSQENELNEDTEIKKILNSDSTFTIEDFKKIGFKINKEYDVTDLDESTGAWFGFWKNNLDKPIDYELRFYPSQQTAIDIGVSLTEEVIGENAVLKKSISSWKEGIQDRRSRNNSSMSGSEANSVRAKYLDYFINGNVIILCSGLDLNYATQNCSQLSSKIE